MEMGLLGIEDVKNARSQNDEMCGFPVALSAKR